MVFIWVSRKDQCSTDSKEVWKEIIDIASTRERDIDLVLVVGKLFDSTTAGSGSSWKGLHEGTYVITRNAVTSILTDTIINLDKKESLPIFMINSSLGKDALIANLNSLCENTEPDLKCYFAFDKGAKRNVHPLLFDKGSINLALYGINHRDDKKVNTLLKGKKIQFVLPPTEKSWFKMLVLYQVRGYDGTGNCGVDEASLPSWMDLVVWGGNKQCDFQRIYSYLGDFDLIEPGNCLMTDYKNTDEDGVKAVGLLKVVKQTGNEENYG